MQNLSPTRSRKISRRLLLLLPAFLTLSAGSRFPVIADEIIPVRLDGYYESDKPLPRDPDPRFRAAWEYIRFYEDGMIVYIAGDKGFEDEEMGVLDMCKSDPGHGTKYTRVGNTIEIKIPPISNFSGYYAQGRITANGLDLKEFVDKKTVSQTYHFVLPPPPPTPDPPKKDNDGEEEK